MEHIIPGYFGAIDVMSFYIEEEQRTTIFYIPYKNAVVEDV